MGEEAALGEAAAKGAGGLAEGGADAAGSGAGDFLSGVGDIFGGGGGDVAADTAGAGAAGGADALASASGAAGGAGFAPGDFSFNPGFSAGDLDYLGTGASQGLEAPGALSQTPGSGFTGSSTTTGGASAFDPGAYSSGAASTPDWLNGGALFDTGVAGAAPAADFSGGVGSFSAPGVSSFADTIAAGGAGPQSMSALQGGADLASSSAFTPGAGIQLPDASAVDPTSLAATGDVTTPPNATPTVGTLPQTTATAQPGVSVTDASGTTNVPGMTAEPTTGAAGTTPAAATSTTAPAASSGKFLGMDLGKPTVFGTGGALLSGGLLASNLLRNNVPGQDQVNAINSNIPQVQGVIDSVNKTAADLRASTAPLNADAQAMMSYVSQGTLPPAMAQQVQAGAQAAKTQAASIMAQHGLSADPTKNAQLKQQFDTIDSQALQLQGTMANQLYQSGLAAIAASNQTQSVAANLQKTGLDAVGLNQNTYLALQKIYSDQDAKTQAAVTNFASALGKMSGGAGSGTTIKIGSA